MSSLDMNAGGFVDAAEYGFSPEATSTENTKALQAAVDQGGTIVVSLPGTYMMANTVFIGSHTTLTFGNGVFLKKDSNVELFTHVLLNKGALTRTWDENIVVHGLHVIVNGVDVRNWLVHGLHGQLAFFYVKDLRIERFRCMDIGKAQYGVHICTFEDVIVDDVIIKGDKDGVHLGRGKRFTIRNGVFATYDDAVALNAHDYSVGNPEMGWIEDGVVENCYDLDDGKKPVGFFARIIAGGWRDWESGMEVQQSDSVISNGRFYRVQAQPDGTFYTSVTQPTHKEGTVVLDGIPWGMMQEDVVYTAGVRNVVFRDIFLYKPRVGFSVHFDTGRYSRSYCPGAQIPMQEQLLFDNVRVLHEGSAPFISSATPVDVLTITNCSLRNGGIQFRGKDIEIADFGRTFINITNCVFNKDGAMTLLRNDVPSDKTIVLRTASCIATSDQFSASVEAGNGKISIASDLPGLEVAHMEDNS